MGLFVVLIAIITLKTTYPLTKNAMPIKRASPKTVSETEVIKTIKDWLALKKIYTLRLQTGSLMTSYNGNKVMVPLCPTGTPDLFTLINGKAVFFEVKKDEAGMAEWRKRVDKFIKTGFEPVSYTREIAQYKAKLQIEKNGGRVFLVCDLLEVERIVNEIQHESHS